MHAAQAPDLDALLRLYHKPEDLGGKALDAAGVAHHDLDYGSYFSMWRQRNALKLWTGWPTFPMVFVKGTLVGGANDLNKLIASGELKKLLAS